MKIIYILFSQYPSEKAPIWGERKILECLINFESSGKGSTFVTSKIINLGEPFSIDL